MDGERSPSWAPGPDRRGRVEHAAALQAIARAAVTSLHGELVLAPKPGLVCPGDRGAHDDMDAATMMRSLFALRHGFVALVAAAASGASFDALQRVGMQAERTMRIATRGVNTHRGALFVVGLLAAAAARCVVADVRITAASLRDAIDPSWRRALACAVPASASRGASQDSSHSPSHDLHQPSHGRAMAVRHGAGGALDEAARGFPSVFDVVLPAFVAARDRFGDERAARLQALMTAIATTEDTNLLYRGGADGLAFARGLAGDFLSSGGMRRPDRDDALRSIGRAFVARRLSPGGSADLLAAALFVDALEAER